MVKARKWLNQTHSLTLISIIIFILNICISDRTFSEDFCNGIQLTAPLYILLAKHGFPKMSSFGKKYACHRKNAPDASDLTIRNWMVSQSLLDPISISELLYWDDDDTLVVVVQFSFFCSLVTINSKQQKLHRS